MRTLKKGAFFTDIHFGKKANSNLHNEDCRRFINWFCEQVRKDPDIDYVGFLGDWNENRSALNVATLNHSYQGAKMLDHLGLPIFFVIGNHDLYHRHTRDIHSVVPFNEFRNFTIIEEPTIIDKIEGRALFCPFLFHEEYPQLTKYLNIPFWAGHFEFKGYVVTG
jgi:predicted MPP superfamily phosphohydrolase